jgi:AraC-like DNA-binding protein
MNAIRLVKPPIDLAEYVRLYAHREAHLHDAEIFHPVPARASAALEFIFGNPHDVLWYGRSIVEVAPTIALVGLQTYRRVRLRIHGTVESFAIFFQPAGLYRLFGIPMHELTNRDCEARALLGASITGLRERLGNSRTFDERAQIATEYLRRVCQALDGPDGVSAAADEIVRSKGQIRIPDLAYRAGLSMRQFERRFSEQIGMRPKLYARIARFEAALDSKAKSTAKSWTEVAHEHGYHDQMHLVHDFEEFSSETPSGVLTQVELAHRSYIDGIRLGRGLAAVSGTPTLIL